MELFRSKANKKAPKAKSEKSETTEKALVVAHEQESSHINNLNSILKKPRITEKASLGAEKNVYLFDVASSANKKTIAAAVKQLYNVTPIKVAITRIPSKNIVVRGKRGVKSGGKKAYIYLEKGQTIEFV